MTIRTSSAVLSVAALAVSVSISAAAGAASHFELRVYDPARLAKAEVTTADPTENST